MKRSPLLILTGAALVALTTTACGTVNDVIDTAQDVGQSADSLIRAATEIGAACATAQAALVPGVSTADAEAALTDALGIVDDVIAANPGVPGAAEVDSALATARQALAGGVTESDLGVARETIQTACALVTLAG